MAKKPSKYDTPETFSDLPDETKKGFVYPYIPPVVNPNRKIMMSAKAIADKEITTIERSKKIVDTQMSLLHYKSIDNQKFTNQDVMILNGLLSAMQTIEKIENKNTTKGDEFNLSTDEMIEILKNNKKG